MLVEANVVKPKRKTKAKARPKRRERQTREITAGELLDVAEALFIERGFAATTVGDVVKRANVTTGALYHVFPDKQALFARVARRVVDRLVSTAAAAVAAEKDPWRQLEAGMTAILAGASGPQVRLAFIDAPVVLGLEAWREIEQEATAPLLGSVLMRLAESGALPPQRALLLGRVIRGAMLEAAMAVAESGKPELARVELEGILKTMFGAFRAQ
ncbi:MAG: TetR/AcrR family transcriptional regulator [Myxococcaceae bacterium]|nr:TetR/AcrR family transcriptional regulator [Myxococcaceae bacterium]